MRYPRPTALTRRPAVLLGSLTLGLALTLTACGNDEPAGDTSAQVSETDHNDADVAFATDMIQHHAQALSMVDLTVDRTLDPEVQQLAEDIREAQGPEIETMSDWLQEWDEEIPDTMRDHSNAGHGMDRMGDSMDGMDSDMPGMMSSDDFDELENAPDSEFQTMWLEMMIEHHEGAVEMAQDQQDDGQYKPAIDLAGDVVDTQSAEIETWRRSSAPDPPAPRSRPPEMGRSPVEGDRPRAGGRHTCSAPCRRTRRTAPDPREVSTPMSATVRTRATLTAIAAGAALLLSGCSTSDSPAPPGAPNAAGETELGHVHGLGVDPARRHSLRGLPLRRLPHRRRRNPRTGGRSVAGHDGLRRRGPRPLPRLRTPRPARTASVEPGPHRVHGRR